MARKLRRQRSSNYTNQLTSTGAMHQKTQHTKMGDTAAGHDKMPHQTQDLKHMRQNSTKQTNGPRANRRGATQQMCGRNGSNRHPTASKMPHQNARTMGIQGRGGGTVTKKWKHNKHGQLQISTIIFTKWKMRTNHNGRTSKTPSTSTSGTDNTEE